MTNSRIKTIFKFSFVPFLLLLLIVIGVEVFNPSEEYDIDKTFDVFCYLLMLPFVLMMIARLYNFLAYGKWVVEE